MPEKQRDVFGFLAYLASGRQRCCIVFYPRLSRAQEQLAGVSQRDVFRSISGFFSQASWASAKCGQHCKATVLGPDNIGRVEDGNFGGADVTQVLTGMAKIVSHQPQGGTVQFDLQHN